MTDILSVSLGTSGILATSKMDTIILDGFRIFRHKNVPISANEIQYLTHLFIPSENHLILEFFKNKLKKSTGTEMSVNDLREEFPNNPEMEKKIVHILREDKIDELINGF